MKGAAGLLKSGLHFIRGVGGDVLRIARQPREGLKSVYGVSLYRNALYLMVGAAVSSLCGFFFWLIVARFYSDEVVGYSSAVVSALSLLAILSMAGLNIAIVRFLPRAESPRDMTNTCFTVAGLISLVAGAVFVAGLGFWSPALAFVRQDPVFLLAFLVFAVLWTLSPLVDSAFLAGRQARFVLFRTVIYSLLKLLLPAVLALYFHTFGVVLARGIAFAISLAVALFVLLPRVQRGYRPLPALEPGVFKKMWRYSGGNYLVDLLSAAPAFVLPLIVVNRLGAEENAYFYIPWMMGNLLFTVAIATSRSLFAEGSNFEERLGGDVMKSLKSTFLLLVPAAVLLAVAGRWLLLAFGPGYALNSLPLLWVLCLASLPFAVNRIYTGILWVTGRTGELITIWGLIATGVLVTSYLIVPLTGIIGIGYAWLGAQGVVAMYILAGRRLIPAASRV